MKILILCILGVSLSLASCGSSIDYSVLENPLKLEVTSLRNLSEKMDSIANYSEDSTGVDKLLTDFAILDPELVNSFKEATKSIKNSQAIVNVSIEEKKAIARKNAIDQFLSSHALHLDSFKAGMASLRSNNLAPRSADAKDSISTKVILDQIDLINTQLNILNLTNELGHVSLDFTGEIK